MADYTFEDLLSPLDFEHLIRDLLSMDLSIELTSFAEGKDKGTDLRYASGKAKDCIVQCKRVKSISKAGIKKEYDSVKKLDPHQYYFAISSELSVSKFDYIKSTFSKWMVGDENIYTRSRLNKLLDKYPDVHQRNYKLWINSSEIFSSIINKPLFERAKALITDLKSDYKYYVKNESLQQAIDILNKDQFIIISGIPGIGKTTLAKLILWEYIQKGYEIIEIRKVIEGEQLLEENSDSKQVFYFDDFLGENFLKYDSIEGRSTDLIHLIRRIMKSKHKTMIMTTREYILKQAKEKYEKLDSKELNIYKYTLDLTSYSKKIRALILYNHLFYSGISLDYIRILIETKAYKKIINHKNYSPRIVEQMTLKLSNVSVEEYPSEFIKNLDNPFGIWSRAFESQISDGAKHTLFILLSVGEPILLSEFKNIVVSYHEKNTRKYNLEFRPLDLKNYLRELEDSFIRINITSKENHYITFQNPSIRDFMLKLVKDNKELLSMILASSIYYNQLVYTLNYLVDKTATDNEIVKYATLHIQEISKIPSIIWILSGDEFRFNKSLMRKIQGINSFAKKSKNSKCLMELIEVYKQVDISKLYSYDENAYIQFTKEHKKKIKPNTENLFTKMAGNISWFENVSSFLALRKIDSEKYDELLNKNKDSIKEKVKSAIKKDIEIKSDVDAIENLSNKLDVLNEELYSRFSIDTTIFNEAIQEKKEELEIENESVEPEELEVSVVESEEKEDEFNEDEFFRIEMFE